MRTYFDVSSKETGEKKKKRKKVGTIKALESAKSIVEQLKEAKLRPMELTIILPFLLQAFGKSKETLDRWEQLCSSVSEFTLEQKLQYYQAADKMGDEFLLTIEPLRSFLIARCPGQIIDPKARDYDVAELFVSRYSESLKFVDSKGDSFEWDAQRRLWQYNTPQQTVVFMIKMMDRLFSSNLVIFTDPDLKVEMMNFIHTERKMRAAMLLAASIDRDYEFEKSVNTQPWAIATSGLSVLDLVSLEVRDRTKEDLFTMETTARLLVENDNEKKEISWRFIKLYDYGRFCANTTLMGEEFDLKSEEILGEIYPNAHRYMCNSLHDIGKRCYLRRRLSLGLTTYMGDRSTYWMHGKGSGGKSHLLETTIKTLGSFGIVANKYVFFQAGRQNASSHKTHMMALKHRRLAAILETSKGDRPDEAQGKALISGDQLSMREMYKKEDQWFLYPKLFTLSQHEATMDPTDTGFVDRTKAVIMDTRFWSEDLPHKPENWNDEKYVDHWDSEHSLFWRKNTSELRGFAASMKLPEEEGGHLNEWFSYLALSACECYYLLSRSRDSGRLPVPPKIIEETKLFFTTNDTMQDFIDEHCTLVSDYKDGDLISKFMNYFNKFNQRRGGYSWNKKSITDSLGAKGYYNPKWRTSAGIQLKLIISSDEHGPLIQFGI